MKKSDLPSDPHTNTVITALPTRQDGAETRDKAYSVLLSSNRFAHRHCALFYRVSSKMLYLCDIKNLKGFANNHFLLRITEKTWHYLGCGSDRWNSNQRGLARLAYSGFINAFWGNFNSLKRIDLSCVNFYG